MNKQTRKERNEDIVEHYASGLTYEEIGKLYGLTRERIRQIIDMVGYAGRRGNGQLSIPSDEMLDLMREKLSKTSLPELKKSGDLSQNERRAGSYLVRTGEYKKLQESRRRQEWDRRRDTICIMLSQGVRQYEIAKRVGVSQQYITVLKNKWGMTRRHVSEDVYRRLYDNGLTVEQMSDRLDRAPESVRVRLRKLGLM